MNLISFIFPNKTIINNTKLAVIGLLISAIGYAVLGINSRLLSQGFEPMTQVYVRIFIGFLLSVIIFRKKIRFSKIENISKHDFIWLLIMSVIGYSISVWMITLASLNAKLVNVSSIYSTIPFIVYLYSYLLLKEKIKLKLIIFLMMASYGVITISSKSFIPSFSEFGTGELFAVLSVIAGGWWSIGRKMLSDQLNNQEITLLTMLIASIFGMIIAQIRGETLNLQSFTLTPVLIGIIIGAILNVGLTFIESFSFKYISAVIGNQILMTTIVFSLILGLIIYHETISFPELVGIFIIVSSVLGANKLIKN
ncbi:MAG: hypothetical protein COZ34_04815 [Candidatus Pacebacteria bacterium CG_4_10_14_3_um_filter_34_15]|nr:DMT family transporter [Candidatus Pacearchaeota archaeon]NCQ65537.1 DMT family transporter [Candidatus Paceibacterota bacterium]OIO44838.1 MAG: hypothetical protein AUJ41_01900 [Candidatus Pacebacteria bacterium CG1_02_43_31]PIQ81282.1 MAG: hypothetical protein COV78_00950 [Candidatus Pacebacteria bacterium CG11_big_fil_rev_8_21_14_0_20_34_55]PIX81109.1 MAG: hypothetical protein COZ34_04815 [Candidatus Pacebacteria bacterium CG_4_10_14_3_um_filter_34_15]PJC43828.1 MAG: hypothetical protein